MPSNRNLHRELEAAEAQAARLRLAIAAGACSETGHDWVHLGGKNASCDLGNDCGCSVPVHECAKCGDCDYGDNAWADRTREECAGRSVAA